MYGRGSDLNQTLAAPHSATYIANYNKILLFNNHSSSLNNDPILHSSIIEFILPDKLINGSYSIDNNLPFEPNEINWEYKENFYSGYQSGVQRLKNGNTLISVAEQNRIFEIDVTNTIVWDSDNTTNTNLRFDDVLRAIKYELDYFTISGDINQDNVINILDIIIISEIILNNLNYNDIADINSDQTNNILDIMEMINIILSNNN